MHRHHHRHQNFLAPEKSHCPTTVARRICPHPMDKTQNLRPKNKGSGGISGSQKYSPARHKSGNEYGSGNKLSSDSSLIDDFLSGDSSISSVSSSVLYSVSGSLALNRRTEVGEWGLWRESFPESQLETVSR
ncbi:unnamed protein product [Microthlaspi erraticum]|uniref:Uncharacterized protein n=1 Tax=Microthlaspi erraticum TaxID=1685480 RepID=A0A6D2JIC6_9BRAS|nr:unnamed protein product [Microthlaspi erraticum]